MATDPCPCCGEPLEYDEVDVGVGTIRGSAFCPSCYWSADNDRQPEAAEPLEPDPDKEFKHEKRLRDLDRAGLTQTPRQGLPRRGTPWPDE